MNAADFDTQFNRLTGHFHLPADAARETVALDWFKAVEHYHVDAMERAVTELIRSAQDRYWPALGKLLASIQSRIDRYDRQPGKCQTCHGSSWIEAVPWKSNGLIYEGLRRCPDCGVPEPTVDERRGVSRLTDLEMHEYRAGRYGRDQMPDGAGAKHPERLVNPEIKAAMAVLRKRLFGSADQVRESA